MTNSSDGSRPDRRNQTSGDGAGRGSQGGSAGADRPQRNESDGAADRRDGRDSVARPWTPTGRQDRPQRPERTQYQGRPQPQDRQQPREDQGESRQQRSSRDQRPAGTSAGPPRAGRGGPERPENGSDRPYRGASGRTPDDRAAYGRLDDRPASGRSDGPRTSSARPQRDDARGRADRTTGADRSDGSRQDGSRQGGPDRDSRGRSEPGSFDRSSAGRTGANSGRPPARDSGGYSRDAGSRDASRSNFSRSDGGRSATREGGASGGTYRGAPQREDRGGRPADDQRPAERRPRDDRGGFGRQARSGAYRPDGGPRRDVGPQRPSERSQTQRPSDRDVQRWTDRPPRDPDRPYGDRPSSDRSRGDRPYGDRPSSDRSRGGDRPYGDRPSSDRSRGDRPYGDRPTRPAGSSFDRDARGDSLFERPARADGGQSRDRGDSTGGRFGGTSERRDRPAAIGDRPDRPRVGRSDRQGGSAFGNREPRKTDRYEHRSGESTRPAPKVTDFGTDLSSSFGREGAAPRPSRESGERQPFRPSQDRSTERSTQDRSSGRPSQDRPAWQQRPAVGGDRPSAWSDREAPRFERREPDRGSRVREEEIGERWPEIPDWADSSELAPEVRRDLRGLSKEGAEFVGAHLYVAGMLAEEDPAVAWRHARAARSKGGRIAVVRETVGLVAYHASEWAEAIAELRAARRMSGGPGQLPVMADCERALGHPEKAIELSRSIEAADLDPSSAAEMRIVVAGARADLGQLDAALAHLEGALRPEDPQPFSARMFYAYADLLLQADRRGEAIDWFMKAAEADPEEETDAGERLTELAGDSTDSDGDVEQSADGQQDDEGDDDEADADDSNVDRSDHESADDDDDDDETGSHGQHGTEVEAGRSEVGEPGDVSPERSSDYRDNDMDPDDDELDADHQRNDVATDQLNNTANADVPGPTGGTDVADRPPGTGTLFSHHEGGR